MRNPSRAPKRQQAMALVIVLGFLVLITFFVVAFFSSITTNSKGSHYYAKNVQTQQLAQSAVSIAMSLIKDATTQERNVTWVSQPGMIKTFDDSGAIVNSYRLYSSKTMKVAGEINPVEEMEQQEDWPDAPAVFVDLNRPARDAQGKLVYPILDPGVVDSTGDPGDQLQGFKFDKTNPSLRTTDASPAPMPVRWMYVLANGEVVNGQISGKSLLFPAAKATKDNPIVGRVAFWVDDETCKVNINTAAGDVWKTPTASFGAEAGSYWDVPRTGSYFDQYALANFQPANGEFQRYPGHPATTYLSAVFPSLTREQIGSIATRVQFGGSEGGTKVAAKKVSNDPDRLYASIEELIFDPNRAGQAVTRDRLEKSRFFLTAHSRAPEVNLFNLPRISIWPLSSTDPVKPPLTRSPYDRLIAFCSTCNQQPYYFTRTTDAARTGAYSPTADYENSPRNQQLYAYLQRLTERAIPGFAGNFKAKYPNDRDQILTEIYDYIRTTNLTDDLIEPQPYTYPTRGLQYTPGRTGESSRAVGHGQVAPQRIGSTMGFGRFPTVSEVALHFICTADPATPESNVGKGTSLNRTLPLHPEPTVPGERAVLEPGQRRIETMLYLELFTPAQGYTRIVPDLQIRITGMDKLSVNGTSLGFPSTATTHQNTIGESLYGFCGWGGSAGFRRTINYRKLPARGVMAADTGLNNANTGSNNQYSFVGIPITVTLPATTPKTMSFSSGAASDDLTIEIYSGATASPSASNLVQTLKVKFPNGAFPVPELVANGTAEVINSEGGIAAHTTAKQNWWSFSADGAIPGFAGRLNGVYYSPGSTSTQYEGAVIRPEDVIRSVLPAHGDYRLIAAKRVVPKDVFTKHRYYDDTSRKMADSLTDACSMAQIVGTDLAGKLVETATYSYAPDIPSLLSTDVRQALNAGDWDTGVARVADGAYINKPDEGTQFRYKVNGIPYYTAIGVEEAGGPTYFSPNRQVTSAGMFGSLPTGVMDGKPWQTLLFRPDGAGTHAGTKSPKDHLLLDLFWMPVVEPYAISEPFSTAGKINMNYQIAPFTYFERTTALRALLKSERVIAIPTTHGTKYKGNGDDRAEYRFEIDADETLKQWQKRFDGGGIFRTASEICDLYLIPKGQTESTMPAYWTSNRLTGDNMRERPYATLYPRLTTKSNAYSVHFCVQTLKQMNRGTSGKWNEWIESRDVVTGESQGTSVIERYIDLDDNLPDFADPNTNPAETIDRHCKLRVIMNRRFAP